MIEVKGNGSNRYSVMLTAVTIELQICDIFTPDQSRDLLRQASYEKMIDDITISKHTPCSDTLFPFSSDDLILTFIFGLSINITSIIRNMDDKSSIRVPVVVSYLIE